MQRTEETKNYEEAVEGLTNAGPDPLKGLVAEDILEKFRAERPVQNTDSVYAEGYILGRWIMKTIGKENFSEELREKGRHIGNANEYWFGTDIANNFSNNIPTMYGTYFALKDYYTSDGKNNSGFYQDALDGYWEYDTAPEAIQSMYDNLKEFITDCNNLVRK